MIICCMLAHDHYELNRGGEQPKVEGNEHPTAVQLLAIPFASYRTKSNLPASTPSMT